LLGAVEELLVTRHGFAWDQKTAETRSGGRELASNMREKQRNFAAFARHFYANVREHGGFGTILANPGWRRRRRFGTICAEF
jgi:hypothetical protein